MALKRSGLELVAEGATQFYAKVERADTAVLAFGRSADRASGGVADLGKAASATEHQVGKLGQIATGALRQIGEFAVSGVLRVAENVLSIGPASLSAAADFEQGMDNISAVAGATADEMEQISGLALQLGKDTSFSASQASAGIEELIKGGVSIADVMDGAAESTLNLAAAGGVELADAAEIAANALAIFNLKGSDMAMVADQIAGAANASSLSVTDFKFSMSAAGSVMAATGQQFDDLSTSIAILGANGIKGSDAGTSLKTMFMNLQPQTKAQIAAFRELNLLTEDGTNAFINANGTFKSAAEIAGILRTATEGLTEAQRIQKLETIFGADAVRAATIFVKEGAEGFDQMAEAMGKVTAQSVAAERLDNLRGDIEQLGGSMETAGIVAGTVFLPAMRDLTQTAIKVVNASIPLIEAYGPDLVANLGAVAGVISDNLVPALFAVTAASVLYAATLAKEIPLLYARGVALMASLGPFALVAAAAFGAAKAYDIWNDGIRANVDRQMEANEVLQEVVALQEDVRAQAELQTPAIIRQQAEIDRQREQYAALAVDLQKRLELEEKGIRSQERSASAIAQAHAALAEQEDQVVAASEKLKTLIQWQDAVAYSQEHGVSAGSAYVGYINSSAAAYTGAADAMAEAGKAAQASAEEIKDAEKFLSTVLSEGASALGDVVSTQLDFQQEMRDAATEHWANLARLHKEWADATTADQRTAIQERIDAENTGYATSQQNAAAAYAAEQGANRAHLGQLLIDTVNAWQTLGKVPAEQAEAMRSGIAEHFGVASDSLSLQFGSMLGVLQGVADGTGVAVDDMGMAFGRLETAAVTSAEHTAATQEQMIANVVAAYNEGKLTWEEYTTALANVPADVTTTVTSNVPEQVAYWQELGEKQGAISPVTAAQIDSNVVDARERFVDFKLAQADIKAETSAMVSDNADEVRGRYLILAAKRAAIALEKPSVNINTNADDVTGQIQGVGAAVRNLPDSKTIHIYADIDPMLLRQSPAPIEQVMTNVKEFSRDRHLFRFGVEGLDPLTKLISGGYADAPTSMTDGKQKTPYEGATAHYRKLIERGLIGPVVDTLTTKLPAAARLPAKAAGQHLAADVFGPFAEKTKSMLGLEIPRDAVPHAGVLGENIGAAMAEGTGKKLKTELGKVIPGTLADVSKSLMSDKNRSDEAKTGKGTKGAVDLGAGTGVGSLGTDAAATISGALGEALDLTKPITIEQMTTWWQDIRRDANAPALIAAKDQIYLAATAFPGAWRDGMLREAGALTAGGTELGATLTGSVASSITASTPAIVAAVAAAIQAALAAANRELGVTAPTDTRAMRMQRVSPPASRQQIAAQQVSNSFAWTGNMIMPAGTTQQQGDAFLDYLRANGVSTWS